MMYKIYFLIFFFIFNIGTLINYAQQENVWVFGKGAGIDFNSGNPVPFESNITGFGEGSASICDITGKLLFYTEGSFVWDRNGNIMPNGENLTDISSTNGFSPTSSTSQGTLIVPVPNNPQRYYIFSLTSYEQNLNLGRLYYSVVNMDLNNGMGDVVPGRKAMLIDSMLTEHMTAVVGEHCNVWLIVASRRAPEFKSFEVTSTGVNPEPVVSTFQYNNSYYSYRVSGRINLSPNRKKLAIGRVDGSSIGGSLELYDFDPITGRLSNFLSLFSSNQSGTVGPYGVCFSTDNSKLYTTIPPQFFFNRQGEIEQYDLNSSDSAFIVNSKTKIGVCAFSDLKRATDGKIYFSSSDTTLGVISAPNQMGMACQYNAHVVSLFKGTSMHLGLPNTIPLLNQDTVYTFQNVEAGCFIQKHILRPNNERSGWDFKWNNGTSGKELLVDTPGLYWVSYYTTSCIYHVDTFNVVFPYGALPEIEVRSSCKGRQNGSAYVITYSEDITSYNYTWLNSKDSILSGTDTLHNVKSGNYKLRITTERCDTTIPIFIPEKFAQLSFIVDSIVCQGNELRFRNTSDAHFSVFQWNFGDGGQSSEKEPAFNYKQPGSYEVMLLGIGEICTDTAYQTIIVDPRLPVYFTTDKDSICQGENIIFTHETDMKTVTDLHWQTGDGNAFFSSDNEIRHAYDLSGTMFLTLTAYFRACPESFFSDTAYVYPLPKVELGTDAKLCLNGTPVILKNRYATDTQHYLWNTGDTTEILRVNLPGIYSLTVSAEPLGCSNTESIEVKKDCYIDIPNAFTPDGDGINDHFFPRQLLSRNVTRFKMQIFNRWGQLVFETSAINGRGWDGRFKDKEQPQDVYVYRVEVEFEGTREKLYQGNLTLIR